MVHPFPASVLELSYPKAVKETYLSVSGYAPDSDDQDSITGNGYAARKALFSESKTAQFLTKIDSDLFNQDLFLISNCEVELEASCRMGPSLTITPRYTHTQATFF